jgi:hypothetical protein
VKKYLINTFWVLLIAILFLLSQTLLNIVYSLVGLVRGDGFYVSLFFKSLITPAVSAYLVFDILKNRLELFDVDFQFFGFLFVTALMASIAIYGRNYSDKEVLLDCVLVAAAYFSSAITLFLWRSKNK